MKIIIGTAVVILLTSVVFFALYFVAPQISEDVFGISYRTAGENPLETAPRSVSEVTGDRSVTETIGSVASGTVSYVTENYDEIMASLNDSGKDVLNYFQASASSLGERANSVLSNIDSEEAIEVINRFGSILQTTRRNITDLSAEDIENLLKQVGVN